MIANREWSYHKLFHNLFWSISGVLIWIGFENVFAYLWVYNCACAPMARLGGWARVYKRTRRPWRRRKPSALFTARVKSNRADGAFTTAHERPAPSVFHTRAAAG